MDKKIKNLSKEDIGQEIVLKSQVTWQEKVSNKNARKYITVTINDGTGIMYANVFVNDKGIYDEVKEIPQNSKCRIVGKVSSLKIGEDGFNSLDITKIEVTGTPVKKVADRKIQNKELASILNMIKNSGYKKLIKAVMANIDKDAFYVIPASERHYVYQGGLVDHIIRTAKFAEAIIDAYDGILKVDKEFLLTAILLFRVGKTKTLEWNNGAAKMTEDGEFFEDSLITLDIVKNVLDSIEEISDYKKKLLLHVIAASKNKSVYGAVTIPKSVEPFLIYHIEMLSLWFENFEAAEDKRIDNENIIYGPNGQVYILSEKRDCE